MNIMTINPKLPTKAGKTEIYYHQPERVTDKNLPSREDNVIRLPIHPRAGIHLLQGGLQFLYFVPFAAEAYNYRPTEETAVYFGGTDEEPFLVRLDPGILPSFKHKGEDGFFDDLKPTSIKRLERIFGCESKRQGDIFAIRAPFNWKVLETLLKLEEDDEGSDDDGRMSIDRKAVFGTRHLLTGEGIRVSLPSMIGRTDFVEGVLRAPDHADLRLRGPHILDQTAKLFDPKNAD